MNSTELKYIAKKMKIYDFLGTFGVDQLNLINQSERGVLIFNTDEAKDSGTHWVGLCITKTSLFFFDPLGFKYFDFSSIHLKTFILKRKKNVFFNNLQIQSLISNFCGVHCLLFCYFLSKNYQERTFDNFISTFDFSDIAEREIKSLRYFLQICKKYEL